MSGSSKVRHRWNIASQAWYRKIQSLKEETASFLRQKYELTLMWLRKALPRPCPSLAPFTRPAMSVTLRKAGTWWAMHVQKVLIIFPNNIHLAGRLVVRHQPVPSLIGNRHPCLENLWTFSVEFLPQHRLDTYLIWVDRAEGEVFSCGLTALCQHIEEGWLGNDVQYISKASIFLR